MNKTYTCFKKYFEEEGYNAFSNKAIVLRLGYAVNKISITKKKAHDRYYLIKDRVKINKTMLRLKLILMISVVLSVEVFQLNL
jgi:hypothetical protein